MKLDIEMFQPQEQLLREITLPGTTQASVAITYAYIIAQESDKADWPTLNAAIRERWKSPSALKRVKEMAWKHVEYWNNHWSQKGAAQ